MYHNQIFKVHLKICFACLQSERCRKCVRFSSKVYLRNHVHSFGKDECALCLNRYTETHGDVPENITPSDKFACTNVKKTREAVHYLDLLNLWFSNFIASNAQNNSGSNFGPEVIMNKNMTLHIASVTVLGFNILYVFYIFINNKNPWFLNLILLMYMNQNPSFVPQPTVHILTPALGHTILNNSFLFIVSHKCKDATKINGGIVAQYIRISAVW